METYCTVFSNRKSMKKVFFGIIIIAAGVLLMLHNIGILPDSIFRILFNWQVLLIAIGFVNIFQKESRVLGVILISVGSFFLLPKVFDFDFNFYKLFWPVILIAIGVHLVTKVSIFKGKNHFDRINNKTEMESGCINQTNVFSGGKHRNADVEFKGGKISAVFGGSELDLSRARLAEGKNILEVDLVFGGVSLIVPSDWIVNVEVTSVMGGFADKRMNIQPNTQEPKRELYIRGKAVFGGGEIKSV